jgi:ribonuclease D
MVKRYFDLPLDKDHTKRCTDWTKMLDMKQKEYAATDAYASLKVFQAIDAERHAKRLPPVRVLLAANTESNASRKRKAVVPACTLTTALRQLRDDLATKHKVSGWHRIMTNAVIADIATVVPTTKVELGAIQSLDRRSFHAYGAEIVDAVKKHADQYQISKRPNLKQGNLKLWTSSTQSSSQGTGSGSQTSYGGSQTGYIGSQPSFSQTTSTTSSMISCYSSPRSHAAAAEEVLEDIDMNVYDEV